MRIRLLPSYAILLISVVACTAQRRMDQTITADTRPIGAGVPMQTRVEEVLAQTRSVADFKVTSRERYDDPAAGVRVSYKTAEGLGADVFVYPADAAPADTSLDQRRAAAHAAADESVSAIHEYGRRGAYQDIVVATPAPFDITGPSGQLVPGVYVALSVRAEGMAKLSDLYVLNLRGTLIKIRATYPVAAAGGKARADIRTFATGLMAALDRTLVTP